MQTETYREASPANLRAPVDRPGPENRQAPAAGRGQTRYVRNSYAMAVHHRQRAYLRGLAWRAFPLRRPVQYDFGCGSGRAIRLLYGMVRIAHGYDTSPALLARARESNVHAVLHEISDTGPVPQPATAEAPVIVTAFRLLRHADPAARERPIAFAARVLPYYGSGLLVVEHHDGRRRWRRPRRRTEEGAPPETPHEEIDRLLDRYGFAIVERRGFALLSRAWYGHRGLRVLARLIDNLACRVAFLHRHAHNVLYVARRVHAGTARTVAVSGTVVR
jgi:SAM-dependent methyltransferase